jgi:hypothetical protein
VIPFDLQYIDPNSQKMGANTTSSKEALSTLRLDWGDLVNNLIKRWSSSAVEGTKEAWINAWYTSTRFCSEGKGAITSLKRSPVILVERFGRPWLVYWQSFANKPTTTAQTGRPAQQ